MIRSSKVRSVKPILERLEDRIQPSFLLAGAVQQLAKPLNNTLSDMQSASTDLQAQFTLIKNQTAPANGYAGAQMTQNKAVADWQRILNDSAAIKATVNTEAAFIHAAAFAELAEGDNTDAILLVFGPLFGFNPINALTDIVPQADKIVTDPTLQKIVNTNLNSLSPWIDSTTPISDVTVAPSI